MQKTLTAQYGLLALVGVGLTLAISSCEFDRREVLLSEGVAFNLPTGDAGGADASDNGGGPESPGGVGGPAPGVASSQLVLSPENLDFGSSVVGFEAYRRVTVTNGGSAPLTQLGVTLALGTDASLAIAQNLCAGELAPGTSCDVRLRFFPTVAGPVSGVFDAISTEQSASIPLTATGVEQGDLLLLPSEGSSTDFGATLLGSAVEASYRIDNPLDVESGVITVDLANPAFTLQPPAPGECEPGVTSLLGGESCNVRVAFVPAERGPNEATLTAISANLGSISLSLSGQGLAPGALALDSSSHDFTGVVLGSAGQFTLSVANGGDVPLTLSSVALGAGTDAAFSITSSDCGAGTVLGGEAGLPACSVQLEFRPTSVDLAMGALAVSGEGVIEQSLTLRGEGLLPGSLVVASDADASADFGQLIIGQSATQRFRVSNPGVEPSGALTLTGSGGFEPLPPSAADDCVPGTTSLVNGSSCAVSVRLTAPSRGPLRGSLTVNSALAGSKSLELQATGLAQARLALDREQVDFGRVVRGDTVGGTVTVRNTGDVPMPAPTLSLGTPTSGQAAAFQFESSCAGNIAPGASCAVTLRFAPSQATAHSVTLNFNSNPGGSPSVLLVAQVVERGSLSLQAAPGSSANFGDVAINTSVTRSFVLTNPGGQASGRITTNTNDARFSTSTGNCNPAGGGGLVDGSSCTFNVTFTPNSSEALSPSLTASSPGAGNTSISITGRGRNAARLTGSNDFNFNTVIRGQSAAARTWTVTNAGDLTSGNVTTAGGNNEFTVTQNTCTARTLAGAQTCTMLVGFTPQDNGNRSGTITVGDGSSSATLTVRGVGQPLPAVGSACLDGRCAGTATCENHSNGQSQVCCAQNCTGNQRCSEDDDFASCELPTVGQGQGCGANVLCDTGLTCNGTNQTCCLSSCTGACRVCNLNGTCRNVDDGLRGGCGSGQECRQGECVASAPPPTLATSAEPAGIIPGSFLLIGNTTVTFRWVVINSGGRPTAALALTRNFNANEFVVESSCLGVPLAPGNTCTLNIVFTPQRPAGIRNVTFTVTAGTLSVSTALVPLPVRVGGGGDCTLGATEECAASLFCQSWFLGQDLDGYGGDVLTGGAPSKSTCSRQPNTGRPPDVVVTDSRGEIAMPYQPASLSGDCCDLPGLFRGSSLSSTPSDVNPGITTPGTRPANACPVPFDFNCDGEAVSQFGRNPTFVSGSCTRSGNTCLGGGLVAASATCPGSFSVASCSFVAPPGPGCVGTGNGGPLSCL